MSCNEFNFTESNECTHALVGIDFLYRISATNDQGEAEDVSDQDFELVVMDRVGGNQLLVLSNVLLQNETGFFFHSNIGQIDMRITNSDTILVGEGTYPYYFKRTESSGRVREESYGVFQFIDRRVQ